MTSAKARLMVWKNAYPTAATTNANGGDDQEARPVRRDALVHHAAEVDDDDSQGIEIHQGPLRAGEFFAAVQ